jgi:hypothetical protein
MSLTVIIGLAIGFYIACLCAVMYFCVYADPDESPTSRFLTETLPKKTWALLERSLPKSFLHIIEFFADRFLAIFYCGIILGGWSIIVFYVYPLVDRQHYVSPIHKYISVVFFAACVVSWRYASTTSPGIITARNLHRYDHFPYDHLLFVAGGRCKTTGIPRLARSKFDRLRHNGNVPRYDHFCGWVYNTIGEENYRYFLLFLLVHVGACAYGSAIILQLFYGHILEQKLLDAVFVDRFSGEQVPVTKWLLFQYIFDRYTLESALALLMVVMMVALGMFLSYHIWLTSHNVTTNESSKWDQVHKWYKGELKRYNEAVEKGEITPTKTPDQSGESAATTTTLQKPTVSDGDVTCTGTSEEVQQAPDPAPPKDDPIEHPGPEPKNIYNRGFVENWKEVIFPISLRKQTRAAVSRPPAGKPKTS